MILIQIDSYWFTQMGNLLKYYECFFHGNIYHKLLNSRKTITDIYQTNDHHFILHALFVSSRYNMHSIFRTKFNTYSKADAMQKWSDFCWRSSKITVDNKTWQKRVVVAHVSINKFNPWNTEENNILLLVDVFHLVKSIEVFSTCYEYITNDNMCIPIYKTNLAVCIR